MFLNIFYSEGLLAIAKPDVDSSIPTHLPSYGSEFARFLAEN